MEKLSYLIFRLEDSFYGLEVSYIREVLFLPAFVKLPRNNLNSPEQLGGNKFIGMVNVRGEIIPVIDFNFWFGLKFKPYQTTDCLVILEKESSSIGIIVNQVFEVCAIEIERIKRDFFASIESRNNLQSIISGVAELVGKNMVFILNPDKLINSSEEDGFLSVSRIDVEDWETNVFTEQIFQKRAAGLKEKIELDDFRGQLAVAVICLNGEYFGVDLQLVKEFTDLIKITPIPCTPPHILGNINLRGEIVTIVDIRSLLNLPIPAVSTPAKAMVVQLEGFMAGIIVDKIFDITYLHPAQLMSMPVALNSRHNEYLTGTTPFWDNIITLLDVGKILTKGELVVNEEVLDEW